MTDRRHRISGAGHEFRGVLLLGCIVAGLLGNCTRALCAVTPELQKAIRASTFEVVVKKPEKDPLSYEKPLPLELLPYSQRTDLYESIGTAFALGHNLYITAGHVLIAGVDGQYGPPSLRGADGKVYAIDRILKFSAAEDFIEFSLASDPAPPGFAVQRAPQIDDPVLAVGNALGEGVVIRDGLFTSQTPEEQDGRWKWIRFSAAASPGNSGGPLLDSAGRVMGIVIAKSPNENLNYALPIARVLDAPEHQAHFDQRGLESLPYLHGTRTYAFQDHFALPLPWPQFVKAYQDVVDRHNADAHAQLLKSFADSLFPRGNGTESLLYDVDMSALHPSLVMQQEDDSWASTTPSYTRTDLPGDGAIDTAVLAGVVVVHLQRPAGAADDAFYGDSKAFMDMALKGLNLRRPVGTDVVRITSLGPALSDTLYTDAWGRKWQLRVWAVPILNLYVVALLLPTPEGYAALLQYSPSSVLQEAKARTELLANQVNVSYGGTLAQWQAYLHRRALLPSALADFTLASSPPWIAHTHRFEISVPAELMSLDLQSQLRLCMAFLTDAGRVVWDVGGLWWYRDNQRSAYLGMWRQPRPPAGAKLELRNSFDNLQIRRSPYDAQPIRDGSDALLLSTALAAPGTSTGMESSDLIYGLSLRRDGHPSAAQMTEIRTAILRSAQVLERMAGAERPLYHTPAASLATPGLVDSTSNMLAQALDLVRNHSVEQADAALREVLASPGFDGLDGAHQHMALLAAGAIALEQRDAVRALGLLRRSSTMETADSRDWMSRLRAAWAIGDAGDSVLALTTLAQRWPGTLPDIGDEHIGFVVHKAPGGGSERYSLLKALFDRRYERRDRAELSAWWAELALLQMERGEQSEAIATLSRVSDPYALIGVRADNRFAPIRPSIAAQLDVGAAAARLAESDRARYLKDKDKVGPAIEYAYALLASLRFEEALQVADTAIARTQGPQGTKAYSDYNERFVWLLDVRSQALQGLRRWDDAVAQELEASHHLERGNGNVSQVINLAGLYNSIGRPKDARATLDRLGSTKSSPYGQMQAQIERLESAMQLADDAEAARALSFMRDHREDDLRTYQLALISDNQLDEAARLLMSRLGNSLQRHAALMEVQEYAEGSLPKRALELQQRWHALLARPDVHAALLKVGTAETYHLRAEPR